MPLACNSYSYLANCPFVGLKFGLFFTGLANILLPEHEDLTFKLYSAQAKLKEEVEKWNTQAFLSAQDLKMAKALLKETEAHSVLEGVEIYIKSLFESLIGQKFL